MTTESVDVVDQLIDAVTESPSELPLAAITAVHNSGRDVHVSATRRRVVARVSTRRDMRLEALTPRETQVATVIAAGYTNRQVAIVLGITVATVKDHVHSILTKTGFQSRSELIAAWYGGLDSNND